MKIIYFSIVLLYSFGSLGCERKAQTLQPAISQESVNIDTHSEDISNVNNFIEFEEENRNISEFPILFQYNGLYGYLDNQLHLLVPPNYDRGSRFTEHGYSWVRHRSDNNLVECKILDRNGVPIYSAYTAQIIMLYDDIISYQPRGERNHIIKRFRDGTILANERGISAYPIIDNIILQIFPGEDGNAFIDLAGRNLFPELILGMMTRGFSEERAVILLRENRIRQIIDIYGNTYGSLDIFNTGRNFSEGLLPVETKDGRTGYVNKNGEFAFLVPFVADRPNDDFAALMASDFQDGYAVIQTVFDPPVWRYINNYGEYVSSELEVSWAQAIVDGLGLIRTYEGKYGFINIIGEIVIEPIFDRADSFHHGYARIIYEGRDGLLNTDGHIFWIDEIIGLQSE